MGLATIWSLTTTGLLTTACIPRIADWGRFMMGVPIRDPKTPPLEMVKVPPANSSGAILLSLPLAPKSRRV